ncbi:hypothetical protein FDZ74_13430, partial [bacterium]
MDGYFPALRSVDWVVVVCANGFHLLCLVMFWLRAQKRSAFGNRFGWAATALAIPLAGVAILNAIHQRGVWWVVLLLPVVVFALVETILDGLLKLNFRASRALALYLLLFYLAQFGLIGYAFLAGKGYG